MEYFENVESFTRYTLSTGLKSDGRVYTFASRIVANKSADMLRAKTGWTVEWVGPQQFMVR